MDVQLKIKARKDSWEDAWMSWITVHGERYLMRACDLDVTQLFDLPRRRVAEFVISTTKPSDDDDYHEFLYQGSHRNRYQYEAQHLQSWYASITIATTNVIRKALFEKGASAKQTKTIYVWVY